MRSIRFNLSTLRPVRLLVAACVCALLVFSHAFPAYSAPVNPTASGRSAPQSGETQLRGIEREAQELVQEKPMSQKSTEQRSSQGPNEVQGGADLGQMNRPDNSQDASSVENKLKNVLEKVTGQAK